MSTNILILEDNVTQLNALEKILQENMEHTHITKASDYASATQLLGKASFQFFLLDIELDRECPDALTGIDFGRHLRSLPEYRFTPILYITSIPTQIQTAVNEVHCQNYILKPYTAKELLAAIDFLMQSPLYQKEPLKICDSNGIYYKLYEDDILYIEADGKDMHLYMAEQDKIRKITTHRYRLTEFLSLLPDDFIRCHKKYIVNKKAITAYDKTTASILVKNCFLKIGRKYKEEFERHYTQA